jgi:hypothetical protein
VRAHLIACRCYRCGESDDTVYAPLVGRHSTTCGKFNVLIKEIRLAPILCDSRFICCFLLSLYPLYPQYSPRCSLISARYSVLIDCPISEFSNRHDVLLCHGHFNVIVSVHRRISLIFTRLQNPSPRFLPFIRHSQNYGRFHLVMSRY